MGLAQYNALIKLAYNYNTNFEHIMTFGAKFSGTPTPGANPNIVSKDTTVYDFETAMAAFVDVIKAQFANTTGFGYAEINYIASPGDDPQWIWAFDTSETGSNGGTNTALLQKVYVYRTALGGHGKMYLLDCVGTLNAQDTPPFAAGNQAIFDYLKGDSSIMVARDGAYPIAGVSVTHKTNDALRRRRLLDE